MSRPVTDARTFIPEDYMITQTANTRLSSYARGIKPQRIHTSVFVHVLDYTVFRDHNGESQSRSAMVTLGEESVALIAGCIARMKEEHRGEGEVENLRAEAHSDSDAGSGEPV